MRPFSLALFPALLALALGACTPHLTVAGDGGLDATVDARADGGDARTDSARTDVVVGPDVLVCPTARMNCGTNCIDPLSDVNNCGACGAVCPSGPHATAECRQGVCAIRCDSNYGDCDSVPTNGCEADLLNDPAHCLTCPTVCAGGANAVGVCNSGSCAIQCNAGYADCDGNTVTGCEAPLDAPGSCGACGTSCTTDPNVLCGGGMTGSCVSACADPTPNQCGTSCVNSNTNPDYCGPNCLSCPRGPNSIPGCDAGSCTSRCVAGFAECDGDPATGCEADIRSDPLHCGGCMTACAERANADAHCTSGQCVYSCRAGFGDCDGDLNALQTLPSTGCETDLSSVRHCRACGVSCSFSCGAGCSNATTVVCQPTGCGVTCAGAYADCDGNPLNGCEAQVQGPGADPDHCGRCDTACPPAPASAVRTCDNGICGFRCDAPLSPCGGGCLDLRSDVNNCGSCGRVCATGQACCNGMCSDLNHDNANCGACGSVCRSNTCGTCHPGMCDPLNC